ncbi:MAG TPA: alpha/beta fold hydrolase [Marmoricola sp.]|nr:alpha/beta fold hydrolase [Marmoricola sp.]
MTTPPTRRTVRSGPVDLAVFEHGDHDGPTVLLVHGWPDTHHLWNGVAELLAADFRVVSYDTRGHGESTDPDAVEAFALEELAADLVAVADAVSPDRPVHLVGHDWGSVQGWEAVCEDGAEERFASFTSISGPNLDHLALWMRGVPSPRKALHLAAQAASSSYVWFFASPAAPPLFRRIATRDRWLGLLRRAEGAQLPTDRVAPTLVDDMVSGLRIYRANVRRGTRSPRERRTTVPVLQLVPTRDLAVRSASYEATPQWVDQVERRRVPYGHWVALSHPEVVATEVARFVREVEPR